MSDQDGDVGSGARRAAVAIVTAAMTRRGGLDEGLSVPGGLEPRERAFARQLSMTTLRRWGQIERILAAKLQKPPPEEVIGLLRIGLAQTLFMDVADHAAVATTVDLAGRSATARPFKGLINAVLRGVLREAPALRDEDLAPPWLLSRWQAAFGAEEARAVCAVIAEEPRTDLSLRAADEAESLAAELEGEVLPGGSVRAGGRGDIAAWPGFTEGRWWVQDAAAAIPARLLNIKPGDSALDLCAAPGGKTLQLAAAGAQVTALDRSASRMKRLTENLTRTGLTAEVVAEPAETWADPRTFDAVLLDAPCSATGTFRRQPEVLWLAQASEIAKLAGVQARLLDAAARRVKPGGRLVYCVCSLEPEEGEGQVAGFLKRHPEFTLAPIAAGEGGAPAASVREDGTLRLLPHHLPGGMDGFFVARFALHPPESQV